MSKRKLDLLQNLHGKIWESLDAVKAHDRDYEELFMKDTDEGEYLSVILKSVMMEVRHEIDKLQ